LHAQLLHGPQVGPVVDFVGRQPMVLPVPGQKRHPLAPDLRNGHFVAGRAVRRVHPPFLHARQKLVKTRTAENADIGPCHPVIDLPSEMPRSAARRRLRRRTTRTANPTRRRGRTRKTDTCAGWPPRPPPPWLPAPPAGAGRLLPPAAAQRTTRH